MMTAEKRRMGALKAPLWVSALASLVAAVIIVLNLRLIVDTISAILKGREPLPLLRFPPYSPRFRDCSAGGCKEAFCPQWQLVGGFRIPPFPLSPPSENHAFGPFPCPRGYAPDDRLNEERSSPWLFTSTSFLYVRMQRPSRSKRLSNNTKGIIEQNGGKITKNEYWGVKTLAFRIKKNRKAHFSLLNIDAPHAAVNEVERLEAISEDVHPLDDNPRRSPRRRSFGHVAKA